MRYAILLLLVGCAAQGPSIADTCSAYGYARGSLEHARCMERTHAQAQYQQAERNRALMEASRNLNSQPITPAYQVVPTVPLGTQIRCRPDGFGGTVCN